MDNEPIDWEATMTQTLTASKAASRGSERVVAAIAEMVEQQQGNAMELRKNREIMSQILVDLQVVKIGQDHLSKLSKHKADQRQVQLQVWSIHPKLILVGLGVLVCVVLFALW